jgi:hypothetical protein
MERRVIGRGIGGAIGTAALALLLPGAAIAGESTQGGGSEETRSRVPEPAPDVAARGPAPPALPRFVPPDRGSPTSRLGGATRGAGAGELPAVEAIVPAEVGLTLEAKPVLYWYLSKPTDVRVDLRLLALDPLETVLEKTLPPARAGGIQRIRLADHGVELAPGRAYQWLVLLVPNPADRSYDRVVGGGIERIAPDAALRGEIARADRERLPFVLAEAGIWYDAIDVLSVEIEQRPRDAQLWNRRAALFEQAGLPEVPLQGGQAAPGFGTR